MASASPPAAAKPASKPKVSRPIIYVALLGVAAYAAVLVTEPEAPAKKAPRKAAARSSSASAPAGFTPEDMTAKFERYARKRQDAFRPRVVAAKSLPGQGGGGTGGAGLATLNPPLPSLTKGQWVLTGVSLVNGRRSALIENPATGDSVFLRLGDDWNGRKVAAIGEQTVSLVDPSGVRTELGFPEPPDPDAPASPSPAAPSAPGAPGRGAGPNGLPVNPAAPPLPGRASGVAGPVPPAPVTFSNNPTTPNR